ncbi:MAG: TIGR03790 family protein [Aeoliella sp.]
MLLRHYMFAAILAVSFATPAFAGGGPENLLLVVNQNSDASKAIANHYIRIRHIAPTNVVYLDWQGNLQATNGNRFREEILKPVLKVISERRLAAQIDYIVYSADFPWKIDFRGDFADLGESASPAFKKQFRPIASLTGATYLWAYAIQKNYAMVHPESNWYVPSASKVNHTACQDCASVVTRGFRFRYSLKKGGQRTTNPKEGRRYFLSTMLGVTAERGNTEQEVLRYLSRSVAADATYPKGTFYFAKNRTPRSKPRHGCYTGVAARLNAEGAHTQVIDGTLPEDARDVVGLMTGAATVSLEESSVAIQPGAICEHFTSYGAAFARSSQTKLSEFLRAGAAGASGTVAEPYAIQAKFPLPSIHLHYHRGCSLAEAFYQSVSGPYQLLIVGDPLCQPWARPPTVVVEGIAPDSSVSGVVKIKTKVTPQYRTEAGKCDLFVDGRLVVSGFPNTLPVPLNTASLPPGSHEIRVVCATDDPLEFQGRAIVPFRVAEGNESGGLTLKISPPTDPPAVGSLRIEVSAAEGTVGVDVLQNQRVVGHVDGPAGNVEIEMAHLGRGPVALWARTIAVESSDATPPIRSVRSAPVWAWVE